MTVRIAVPFFLAAALIVSADAASAQEKVYTSLTTDQMEQILKGMNAEYKKTASPTLEGIFFYDITKGKHTIRLHYFKGKDLMVDSLFKEYPLDNVNKWNRRTKFNRAVLYQDPKGGQFVALESNLDLAGGVSENAIRRFIQTYKTDMLAFEKFLGSGPIPEIPQVVQPGGDKIYFDVTSDKIESVLQSLNLTYKKQALKDGNGFIYDYQSRSYKIRLYNFKGKDLMLNAVFDKQPLETINKYNFSRKFIRTVLYTPPGGADYTSLEANQDCSAGVTDNLLRHFIVTFDEEIQSFVAFLNKK